MAFNTLPLSWLDELNLGLVSLGHSLISALSRIHARLRQQHSLGAQWDTIDTS